MSEWSRRHTAAVGQGQVDQQSSEGIWHSKSEAWKGIDDVFPTDTRYAYQSDHEDRGDSAKVKKFIDHVKSQLSVFEKSLPRGDSSTADKAEISSLQKVLEAGKASLARIEGEVQSHGAASPSHKAAQASQLRQQPSSSHRRPAAAPAHGLRAHYISDKSARNDIASYFDQMDRATESENRDNAEAVEHEHVGSRTTQAKETKTQQLASSGNNEAMEAFARRFGNNMGAQLSQDKDLTPVTQSESCELCVKIFGCESCCEGVCTPGEPPSTSATKRISSSSKLARTLCMCTSKGCEECLDEGRVGADGRVRETLEEASKAVATTNSILRDRIAALEATNSMAVRQRLTGAYGEESDDAVWSSREPYVGKSETVASGASDLVKQLAKDAGLARARDAQLRARLATVEKVALEGAVASERQRREISRLEEEVAAEPRAAKRSGPAAPLLGLAKYGEEAAAADVSRPFWELSRRGRRATRQAVEFFEDHPNQARADQGPHPIISGQ